MRVHSSFPARASGHHDLMKRTQLKKNERVIEFPVDVSLLPPGTACLRESTILDAVDKLGYQIVTPELQDELDELRRKVAELEQLANRYYAIKEAIA
jgi:hypothetical protein